MRNLGIIAILGIAASPLAGRQEHVESAGYHKTFGDSFLGGYFDSQANLRLQSHESGRIVGADLHVTGGVEVISVPIEAFRVDVEARVGDNASGSNESTLSGYAEVAGITLLDVSKRFAFHDDLNLGPYDLVQGGFDLPIPVFYGITIIVRGNAHFQVRLRLRQLDPIELQDVGAQIWARGTGAGSLGLAVSVYGLVEAGLTGTLRLGGLRGEIDAWARFEPGGKEPLAIRRSYFCWRAYDQEIFLELYGEIFGLEVFRERIWDEFFADAYDCISLI